MVMNLNIPSGLISQLNEHTYGYLLFYIDKENELKVITNIDNEISLRAIATKAIDVGDSLMNIVSVPNKENVEDED